MHFWSDTRCGHRLVSLSRLKHAAVAASQRHVGITPLEVAETHVEGGIASNDDGFTIEHLMQEISRGSKYNASIVLRVTHRAVGEHNVVVARNGAD